MSHLPYRRNVGAALFNADGLVLMAHRADQRSTAPGTWQMPQGGIDRHEEPRQAVLRELHEEIGTNNAEILAEHPEWLSYELPKPLHGKYRGQTQKWFALRFLGQDSDVKLDGDADIEFDDWRWMPLAEAPSMVVGFKQPIYRVVAAAFERFVKR
jgi:putative (di)nucleoside polyphosphate hydrolase